MTSSAGLNFNVTGNVSKPTSRYKFPVVSGLEIQF